ncbi:competence/damage-inducible protein CinA [Klebsiella pneumoniae subsp. ozaenae]|uniref:Competence/damage-inducible protein CinA n=1 Tax=Klebsiella pneumoniae subsp. ozaenae TaxID=574 RepID=A0A378A3L2_KLEPO|nr:competence/damage-inducible protein CinA [Klebsiella pneumoniae subsp. ozaenae]
MLALWPEVRKVAGDSLIFEGTEGLPAQIARCLQERQLSLTLSEQFTSGLLALQLSRAGAPLLASEVVPAQEETLAQAARWAAERRINHFAGLALAVSGQENDHLNVALATPDGTFALRVNFRRHPPQPGGTPGSLRYDGVKHAASLAEWPTAGQRTWLD